MDRFDGGYELLDDGIIANITEEECEVDRNTYEEEYKSLSYINHQTAHDMFTKCIYWYETLFAADLSIL
jgi:hypothetical protein